MKNKKLKKMRSSRGKVPLRMTPEASDEILSRPRKTRAQDDIIFYWFCIFRINQDIINRKGKGFI
jgi:hypothetical protein